MRTKIGTLTVPEDYQVQKTYECAAWYRNLKLTPGTYDVMATIDQFGRFEHVCAAIPGVVVGSNFSSYFCGNQISARYDSDLGEEDTYYWQPYAYSLASAILEPNYGRSWQPSVSMQFNLSPEFEAYWSYFVWDGSQKRSATFRRVA